MMTGVCLFDDGIALVAEVRTRTADCGQAVLSLSTLDSHHDFRQHPQLQ